jgi:hypothetical protein
MPLFDLFFVPHRQRTRCLRQLLRRQVRASVRRHRGREAKRARASDWGRGLLAMRIGGRLGGRGGECGRRVVPGRDALGASHHGRCAVMTRTDAVEALYGHAMPPEQLHGAGVNPDRYPAQLPDTRVKEIGCL